MARSFEEDPLTLAIAPPPDETAAEKQARELAEQQARKVSDEIDSRLQAEKAALKKKPKPVKVLLLGQSESGKSATLKNFQRAYSRKEWAEERDSWRSVIQLNLLRNVNDLLEYVARELSESTFPLPPESRTSVDSDSPPKSSDSHSEVEYTPVFTEKHQLLKLKLAPLHRVQKDLEQKLGPASGELYTSNTTSAAPFSSQERQEQEFSFNSSNGWKSALERFRPRFKSGLDNNAAPTRRGKDAEADEATEIIVRCRDDIKAMWEDAVLRKMLLRQKSRIEESPGFFLNDVDRIASHDYKPTDDDIIRARLRTLGVQEYKFVVDNGRQIGREWLMYDVGGSRSSRAAWFPYFDDADAIIFLAPISCFDETLAEDRRVNRLEDSYLLWKSLCACKLLTKAQIILFLNKCDLLQAKLMRGVKIRDRVPSYGDRKNDTSTATKYFRQHFKDIAKKHSPVQQRALYIHFTSVIDTKATAMTLAAVEESILFTNLECADLV